MKERDRRISALISNPFGFTKRLLGDKRNGNLECTAEEIERGNNLGENDAIVHPKPPDIRPEVTYHERITGGHIGS